MRLYPLPARSPELNPTEQVWDELREKWLANRMFDCQEAVDCQVQKGLAALEQDRSRVASLAEVRHDKAGEAAKSFRISSGYGRVCTTFLVGSDVFRKRDTE
jgi:DDE superfamily endonuclease